MISTTKRTLLNTYYSSWADQLSTTSKYKACMLHITYWGMSRVDLDLTSTCHNNYALTACRDWETEIWRPKLMIYFSPTYTTPVAYAMSYIMAWICYGYYSTSTFSGLTRDYTLPCRWKCYIITLVNFLQLSLRPEVYPEMSDSTATYCTRAPRHSIWSSNTSMKARRKLSDNV